MTDAATAPKWEMRKYARRWHVGYDSPNGWQTIVALMSIWPMLQSAKRRDAMRAEGQTALLCYGCLRPINPAVLYRDSGGSVWHELCWQKECNDYYDSQRLGEENNGNQDEDA